MYCSSLQLFSFKLNSVKANIMFLGSTLELFVGFLFSETEYVFFFLLI